MNGCLTKRRSNQIIRSTRASWWVSDHATNPNSLFTKCSLSTVNFLTRQRYYQIKKPFSQWTLICQAPLKLRSLKRHFKYCSIKIVLLLMMLLSSRLEITIKMFLLQRENYHKWALTSLNNQEILTNRWKTWWRRLMSMAIMKSNTLSS